MNKEGIEKLKAHTDNLLDMLIRAYERFLFVRPMMVNDSLVASMGKQGKRQGFEQLRNTLYWDFINELVKICAKYKDERTPSIQRIVEYIKADAVRNILEQKYASGRSLFDKQDEYKIEFRSVLARLDSNVDKLLGATAYSGYKEIRDSLIAHNDLRRTETGYQPLNIQPLGLKYGNEVEILILVNSIVDDLNSVIRCASFDWNSFFEPEVRTVCDFWGITQIEPHSSKKRYPWSSYDT